MFLAEIDRVTLWAQLMALIELDYLKPQLPSERLALPLAAKLRVYGKGALGCLSSIPHMAPVVRLTAVGVSSTVRFTYWGGKIRALLKAVFHSVEEVVVCLKDMMNCG